MKIGVRAHDLGRHDIDELPKVIKAAGFETIQLAPAKVINGINSFADITQYHMDAIANAFAREGVEIHILGCYIEPSVANETERLQAVETFKQNITFAKTMGIRYVGTETTHLDPYNTTPEQRAAAYNRLKDSVLRMVEHAEKENIQVAIEPVAEHTLNTPELAHQLVTDIDSDKLSMIFDPVNLILPTTYHNQDQIYQSFFDLLGSHLCVLHAKDTTFSGDTNSDEKIWANIGKGTVNYDMIMPYLKANHPDLRILREVAKLDSYAQDLQTLKSLVR